MNGTHTGTIRRSARGGVDTAGAHYEAKPVTHQILSPLPEPRTWRLAPVVGFIDWTTLTQYLTTEMQLYAI